MSDKINNNQKRKTCVISDEKVEESVIIIKDFNEGHIRYYYTINELRIRGNRPRRSTFPDPLITAGGMDFF